MKPKEEETTANINDEEETIRKIDTEQCELHPLVRGMRFDDSYDTAGLEESIRENGQIHPAVAKMSPDGKRVQIIVGWRRREAINNTNHQQSDEKKLLLKVIIKNNLTDEQIIKLALAENLHEREQRRDVSTLEMITYSQKMLQMYSEKDFEEMLVLAGHEKQTAHEIIDFASRVDLGKIERLHMMEKKDNEFKRLHVEEKNKKEKDFRFELRHLDFLQQVATNNGEEGEKKLYQTAALIAYTRKPLAEVKPLAELSSYLASKVPWFREFFHDCVDDDIQEEDEEEPSLPGNVPETKEAALPEQYIILKCHYCGLVNPLKTRGQTRTFIAVDLKGDGTVAEEPIGAFSNDYNQRRCGECGKSYWFIIAVVPREDGKQRVVAGTSEKMDSSLPDEEAVIRTLYWDSKVASQRNGQWGWVSYDRSTKKKFVLEKNGSELVEV